MSAPIVLAKRDGGGEWVYEPETCPACDAGYRDDLPCGVCRGTGVLFEDGTYTRDQARALGLARSGDENGLMRLADMLTAEFMDRLLQGGRYAE